MQRDRGNQQTKTKKMTTRIQDENPTRPNQKENRREKERKKERETTNTSTATGEVNTSTTVTDGMKTTGNHRAEPHPQDGRIGADTGD